MALVYFLSDDGATKVAMDIETSISVSLPSQTSRSSTMQGGTVSDEVIEGNATIAVSGVVTYAKTPRQEDNLSPLQFGDEIQKARRGRKRFTLYIKNTGQPLLRNYKNCVISNFNPVVDKYTDTITVSISFTQEFISEAAKVAYLAPQQSESAKPTTASTSNSGNAAKTETTKTTLKKFYDWVAKDEAKTTTTGEIDGTTN